MTGKNCHLLSFVRHGINPLNVELNPIRLLLALVGARHIVHVSRIRVKPGTCQIQIWSVAAKFCFMLLARPVPTDTDKASD